MIRSYTRWRDCYSDTIGVYLTAVPCELHEIVEQLFMFICRSAVRGGETKCARLDSIPDLLAR